MAILVTPGNIFSIAIPCYQHYDFNLFQRFLSRMGSCVAFNCTNRCSKKIPGLTFHSFPKDESRRKLWVKAVRREKWEPSKYSKLCSKHFPEEMIDRTSLSCVRLRENAVPSIFDFPSHLQKMYSVVYFHDLLELIPTKWRTEDNKSYYPPYRSRSKIENAIKLMENPEPWWRKYEIKRVFGTAATYEQGIKKLKAATKESEIKLLDCENVGEKRKYEETNEDTEGESIAKKQRRTYENDSNSDDEYSPSLSNSSELKLPSHKYQSTNTCSSPQSCSSLHSSREERSSDDDFKNDSNSDNEYSPSLPNPPELKLPSHRYQSTNTCASPQSCSSLHSSREERSSDDDFKNFMKKSVKEIFRKLNRLEEKLQVLQETVTDSKKTSVSETELLTTEEDIFPLASVEEVEDFEGKLEEVTFFKTAVNILKRIGGTDNYSIITGALKKVLPNEVAEQYSLAGAKKKRRFRDLILYKVLLETARCHKPNLTEVEFGEIVARWLVQAKLRRERAEERKIQKNTTS